MGKGGKCGQLHVRLTARACLTPSAPVGFPLWLPCSCRCTGDDGINVCGEADPCFRRCTVSVRKCGARTYGGGRGRFEDCTFEKCQEQAVKAMESSAPTFTRSASQLASQANAQLAVGAPTVWD
jgi:hypothetical protein